MHLEVFCYHEASEHFESFLLTCSDKPYLLGHCELAAVCQTALQML